MNTLNDLCKECQGYVEKIIQDTYREFMESEDTTTIFTLSGNCHLINGGSLYFLLKKDENGHPASIQTIDEEMYQTLKEAYNLPGEE